MTRAAGWPESRTQGPLGPLGRVPGAVRAPPCHSPPPAPVSSYPRRASLLTGPLLKVEPASLSSCCFAKLGDPPLQGLGEASREYCALPFSPRPFLPRGNHAVGGHSGPAAPWLRPRFPGDCAPRVLRLERPLSQTGLEGPWVSPPTLLHLRKHDCRSPEL